ncbi:hypothetical protein ACPB8Q_03565 [Methanocaldococcus indicus]|uniref:hypothetical protein n=1 Tax=Methanocaldococcus indicus TaxID=213231 RepID=UPI003C6DB1FA
MLKKSKEEIINFIKSLPENRKIFINLFGLWIEVSKEEAIKFIEESYKENNK